MKYQGTRLFAAAVVVLLSAFTSLAASKSTILDLIRARFKLELVKTSTQKPPSGKPKYGSHTCRETDQKDKKCFTEVFQEPMNNTRAVDVLFVIQTSAPSEAERAVIAAGINGFIAALPANSDFNIGVMLGHGSTSNQSGKLYQAGSEPLVLKSKELPNSQIQAALNSKLTQVVSDPDSAGGEEALYSLFQGITVPTLLQASQSAGFFRPTAALAVVFVATNRDICSVPPAGVPAETDPVKISARIRDCEGLTVQGLTNRLKSLKGALPLAVSGIIYADGPVPTEGGNGLGYGYTDMINLNSGIAIDITNDNIATELASIALLSGQQMVTQNKFILSHSGGNSATIKVTVNGQNVPFQVSGNTVTVSQSISGGATVIIQYCVASNATSVCTHKHGKPGSQHCGKSKPSGSGGNNNDDDDHDDDGRQDRNQNEKR